MARELGSHLFVRSLATVILLTSALSAASEAAQTRQKATKSAARAAELQRTLGKLSARVEQLESQLKAVVDEKRASATPSTRDLPPEPSLRQEAQKPPDPAPQPTADPASLPPGSLPSSQLSLASVDALQTELKRRDCGAKSSSGYGRGMTLVLDEKAKKFIRFLSWAQVWTAFTDNNPGTVDAYDQDKGRSLDIGLRRARFLVHTQLNEKYLLLAHVGINNQTFTNGGGSGTAGIGGYGVGKKPQIFVHEICNEYTIIPPSKDRDLSLSIGAGLHFWNGISRKSSSSTLSYMTLDSPIFCWPNIENTDQFARQLGWYAKGKLRKLDYRVSVNQPFNADDRASLNTDRAVDIAAHSLAFAGYFDWQFRDQESNVLPYRTSSWLGEKSVFNIGAGFYLQPNASGILDAGGQLRKQDHLALGLDCYLDKPVGKDGAALTLYGTYYHFDYGDNYFRSIGILNTGRLGSPALLAARGITPTISGAGNAQPLMGTGEVVYVEGGYVLPSRFLGASHPRLQPFGAITFKNLDWLDDPAFNWDLGFNYLIDGHRSKVTCQYSRRPQFFGIVDGGVARRVSDGSAGEVVIQAQVAL